MATHQFKVGSTVTLTSAEGKPLSAPELFTVEAQMPPVGTSLQYRIRSGAEGFSRVVVEQHLQRHGPVPTGL